MTAAFQFDPLSPEFQANPYAYYDALRTFMPRFFYEGNGWNNWFLSRYDDCVELLRDSRLGREIHTVLTREELGWPPEPEPELVPLMLLRDSWMLFRDPPTHTRLRSLVHKAFTPRMIERLRARIQATTDALIDQAEADGGMDVIDGLAFPLPIQVIAEMLGVPPSERETFRRWSRELVATLELQVSMEQMRQATEASNEFRAYFRTLSAERRREPQDDLLSALVLAEDGGDRLSEDELLGTCILLLAAGHETTVNLIGSGLLALLRHPDQLAKLRDNPALSRTAVEELLRYDSPVQLTARWILEDFEYRGVSLKKGHQVTLLLGAANRDPERFTDPNTLDITRADNPHLAFGSGIHYCLGAPLARLEAQIAFETLLRRVPNLRLETDDPTYRRSFVIRGVQHLPVRFG